MNQVIDPSLVQQKVLLVVSKHERGLVLKEMLRAFSAQIHVALSITDAIAAVKQTLPYLIICEHSLSDGDCFTLQRKWSSESWFGKSSMVVVFAAKSEKYFEVCKQHGMIPLLATQLDQKLMTQLFVKLTQRHRYYSPFSRHFADQEKEISACTLAFSATVMGKLRGLLVVKSALVPSFGHEILCVPKSNDLNPCILRRGSSIPFGNEMYNVFPIDKISGLNLNWLGALPELQLGIKNNVTKSVIYIRSSDYNDQKYQTLLASLGYQYVLAENWSAAMEKFTRGPSQHKIILATEMPDAATIAVLNQWPESVRPVCLIASADDLLGSDAFMHNVRLPIGYGTFSSMLDAANLRGDLLNTANAQGSTNGAGMAVALQCEGLLHSLDEIGGVVESPVAVHRSGDFEFVKFFDSELNNCLRKVSVGNSKPSSTANCFHLRFEARQMAMSQSQFLTKLNNAAWTIKAS